MLKLYNTLKRKKEEFKPIKDKEVGIYSCGPTVYFYPHIGNMRAYIFADILKRTLLYNGFKVKHVINVTDVGHLTSNKDEGEDKIEKEAKREKKTAKEISDFYFKVFLSDTKKLNILPADIYPKATEHIKEQIELIKILEKKGYTYKTSDGIYFDTSKFKNYGKLAKLKKEELKAGARIEMREKKHNTDFALWKFSEKPGVRQQEWESPWGLGFPGWHIECSAMSMKYLGEHFDIHTGGEDHIPVHHTNEIAQSECATGKKFVNYWLHSAFLTFKGEKVSKSTGGLYTISDLEGLGYKPLAYRYLILLTHYRKPLDFSLTNLDAAKTAFDRITKKIIELKKEHHKGEDSTTKYEKAFSDAINDDLNTPLAVQIFIKALEDFDFDTKKKLALLEKFDEVLGLGVKEMKEEIIKIPDDVKKLIESREKLRRDKKWADADVIRERIKEKGYIIKDTPKGPIIEKI
ncbi:MAG: cysteine--tRNA ligase [Candidatus Pacearchaeota archaeon]